MARLPAAEQAAVDRFLGPLERLRREDLVLYAARPLDEGAHRRSVHRAAGAARLVRLTDAVTDARRLADVQIFSRDHAASLTQPVWARTDMAKDRANIADSLGDAVTAIILGDRLDPADRDELLGLWVDRVDDA